MTEEHPRLDGRYELGEIIGRGGMSVVHRSFDHRTGRSVAVKIFRPGPDVSDAEQRHLREVTLLAGLHDPGLITVFDADLAGDMPYLVTELVDGPTLAQRITESALSEDQTTQLGAALARTLAYVHEHGIVHRDIKPANILLPAAIENPFTGPKLVDFGIALVAGATRLTGTNLMIGTANYLGPEQLLGTPVTPVTDIYSLGLVLIEALAGRPAYPGTGIEAASARLDHAPEIPPCSTPVHELLIEMTAVDPDDRPDAVEVTDRLTELAPAESLTTEVVPLARPALPSVVPTPADVSVADVDDPGVGIGPGGVLVGGEPAEDLQPPRNHRIVAAAAVVAAALAVVILIASFSGRHTPGSGPQSPVPPGHPTSTTSAPPLRSTAAVPTDAPQPPGQPAPSTTPSSPSAPASTSTSPSRSSSAPSTPPPSTSTPPPSTSTPPPSSSTPPPSTPPPSDPPPTSPDPPPTS